jgi:hypothetical protein
MMGGTVSFQLGFGFLRMAYWISSVQRRQVARMALSVSDVMTCPHDLQILHGLARGVP